LQQLQIKALMYVAPVKSELKGEAMTIRNFDPNPRPGGGGGLGL
jgi:hypothetical protein